MASGGAIPYTGLKTALKPATESCPRVTRRPTALEPLMTGPSASSALMVTADAALRRLTRASSKKVTNVEKAPTKATVENAPRLELTSRFGPISPPTSLQHPSSSAGLTANAAHAARPATTGPGVQTHTHAALWTKLRPWLNRSGIRPVR